MKNSKGKRTTLISIAGLIVFMTVLSFYFFGKKDMSSDDFTVIITSVIAFFTFLIGLSAKDSNQSHTKE
jgi:hypothetical protein